MPSPHDRRRTASMMSRAAGIVALLLPCLTLGQSASPSTPTAQVKEQDARWGGKAFATAYAPDLSPADKVAGLSELWAQAKYGFANFWHVPTLNWDQSYRDFIPQVLNTTSTLAYYQVLQRFYAQLQDGHTNVYFPKQVYDGMARLPLRRYPHIAGV